LIARYSQTFSRLHDFAHIIISENERFSKKLAKTDPSAKLSQYIHSSTHFEILRIQDLYAAVRAYQDTASSLIPGVLNLILHQDLNTNIALAAAQRDIATQSQNLVRETAQLARNSKNLQDELRNLAIDSRNLAEATRRDSTSMMTISFVTMMFLPGTFTAVSELP
jgi:hypothetical protein